MRWYLLKRLLYAAPVIFGVLVVVFIASNLIPGDPAEVQLGLYATTEQIEAYRRVLGLDRPLPVRLGVMVLNYARGRMGDSISTQRPVIDEIAERFPYTAALAVSGMCMAVVFGVGFGIAASIRRNSLLDIAVLGRVWRLFEDKSKKYPIYGWALISSF